MPYNHLDFFSFLQRCVSVQHAAHAIRDLLRQLKFSSFSLNDLQNLISPKGFLTNQHATIAWKFPTNWNPQNTPIRIAAAHIDSPCLKVRQYSISCENFHTLLHVVPYGSPIAKSFVNIPLALAGEVFYAKDNQILSKLVCSQIPIAIIPHLAIHLSETQDAAPETFWKAIYCENTNFNQFLCQQSEIPMDQLLEYQLNLYDPTPPTTIGSQWMHAPRLDDLSMVYCALHAFFYTQETDSLQIVAFFDHEEIGSSSSSGAHSSLLEGFLETITKTTIFSLTNQLQTISLDTAHGLHPLFPEKHAAGTPSILGGGPCIKIESNLRYAQDHLLSATIRLLCKEKQIPIQTYEPKSGSPCGSTIGPILSAKLSSPCIDMGIPIWGMHANREVGCWSDMVHMKKILEGFFQQ